MPPNKKEKVKRVRISTWFDEGSDALIALDAVCAKMGTTRGEGLRFVAIAWLDVPDQPLPVPRVTAIRVDKPAQKKTSESPKEAVHEVRVNDDGIDAIELDD